MFTFSAFLWVVSPIQKAAHWRVGSQGCNHQSKLNTRWIHSAPARICIGSVNCYDKCNPPLVDRLRCFGQFGAMVWQGISAEPAEGRLQTAYCTPRLLPCQPQIRSSILSNPILRLEESAHFPFWVTGGWDDFPRRVLESPPTLPEPLKDAW